VSTAESARTAPDAVRMKLAIRELQRSGRRLVQRRSDWAVIGPCGGSMAVLTQADVATLAANGKIAATEGGGYVAVAPPPEPADLIFGRTDPVAKTGDWVFKAAGLAKARVASGAGFAGLVRRAQAGVGPLTLRQAAAGLRLVVDAEQSARAERITMDWDGVVGDRQRRRGRDGGLGGAGRKAAVRISRLKCTIGTEAFELVWSACVDRVAVRLLARRRGVTGPAVRKMLADALEKLAAAYDGAVAA
jgi:Domain of unknown function (DUF6456)